MDVSPRLDRSNVSLDSAPPSPAAKRAKTMMDGPDGIGEMGGSSQAKALSALQRVQQGVQQLALVLPDLAPQLGDFLNQLQQVTVNAVASMTSGGPSGAPGIAPMAPPPPPMPMTGAPPAAVPGMAGGM